MTFKFRLYRILTSICLFFSSFLTLTGISLLFQSGFNPLMLLLAAFLSLFFVNSILSLYLQRSLLIPQFNLKESTPSGIKITGGIILFFTTIWIIRAVQLIVTAKTGVEAMREQVAALNEELAKTISSELLVGTGIIILAFSALFFSNALLGIIYLKKWKKQQEEQHNHYPDDDNLQL